MFSSYFDHLFRDLIKLLNVNEIIWYRVVYMSLSSLVSWINSGRNRIESSGFHHYREKKTTLFLILISNISWWKNNCSMIFKKIVLFRWIRYRVKRSKTHVTLLNCWQLWVCLFKQCLYTYFYRGFEALPLFDSLSLLVHACFRTWYDFYLLLLFCFIVVLWMNVEQ